jgi:hypothetical protein
VPFTQVVAVWANQPFAPHSPSLKLIISRGSATSYTSRGRPGRRPSRPSPQRSARAPQSRVMLVVRPSPSIGAGILGLRRSGAGLDLVVPRLRSSHAPKPRLTRCASSLSRSPSQTYLRFRTPCLFDQPIFTKPHFRLPFHTAAETASSTSARASRREKRASESKNEGFRLTQHAF